MADHPLAVGEVVLVSARGQNVRATVTLASADGRDLLLGFGGRLFNLVEADGNEDTYVGALPVVRGDDGVWIDVLTDRPVTLRRA